MNKTETRKKWRKYYKAYFATAEQHENEYERIWNEWLNRPLITTTATTKRSTGKLPTFLKECIGMTCGAKTRAGTPCKLTIIYKNGRCKFHGGLSTGPKTPEGKKRSSMNGFKLKKQNDSHEVLAKLHKTKDFKS